MMYVAAFYVLRLVTGPTKRTSAIIPLPAPLRSGRTDAGLCRTRDGIRAFRILVTHDDFPRFLWENERVDEEDMKKGFLRGRVLVKVCFSIQALSYLSAKGLQAVLAILIAPSAARPGGQSSGAGGYADRLNLQTLTIGTLALAATMVGSLGSASVIATLLTLYRYDSHFLRIRSAPGRRRLAQVSTTCPFTNKSSQPSSPGWRENKGL
jgi:hypothetical protein